MDWNGGGQRVGCTPPPFDIAGAGVIEGDEFEGGGVWASHQPPSTTSQEREARMCQPAPLSSSRTAGDNDIPRRCPRDLPPHPPCCNENPGERRRASRRRRPPPHPFPPLSWRFSLFFLRPSSCRLLLGCSAVTWHRLSSSFASSSSSAGDDVAVGSWQWGRGW